MNRFVVDASVAIKWVVSEIDSDSAIDILEKFSLVSPDLLIAECANILWKKARLGELSADEAMMAAELLQHSDIEILPTRHLLEVATRLAIRLDHAAYDCVYLVLALELGCPFITADDRLRRKLAQVQEEVYSGKVLSITQARELQFT